MELVAIERYFVDLLNENITTYLRTIGASHSFQHFDSGSLMGM